MDTRGREVTTDGAPGGSLVEGAIRPGLIFAALSGGNELVGVNEVSWDWSPGPELKVAADAAIVCSDPVRQIGEPDGGIEVFGVLGDVKGGFF